MKAPANTLTQAEFARQAGVSRQAVNQALADGRLQAAGNKVVLGETGDAKDLWDLTASPLPQHQTNKAAFEEAKQGGSPTPPEKNGQTAPHATTEAMPPLEKLGAALKLETYKLQKAKAETANLELDKAAGALVDRTEVDFVLADFGHTLRGLLEGLPDRLAGSLAMHRGDVNAIHKDLEDTAHDLLTEMSEHMKRRMENV